MIFKGRTVLAFAVLSMFASSLLTLTLVNPAVPDRQAQQGKTETAADGMTAQEMNKLSSTFGLIRSKALAPADRDKLVTGAIKGMVAALEDPFSSYMDMEEAKRFGDALNSSFQGIGAEVALQDGRVTVMAPIKGSPAERAGLHAGDIIVSVNGDKVDGLPLGDAVAKIRGVKGTQAKLGIIRGKTTTPIEIIVVRDDIPMETVHAEMLEDGIGKIEIRQFGVPTARKFAEHLSELEAKGMKGLVIDVRNDPGGQLESVVEIAQHFIERGKPIVQVEDRGGHRAPTLSELEGAAKRYPVAILTDGGSASASEILAGALKESAGATLIGEKTYGKGTVQVTYDKETGDSGLLKMTVYKWLTPAGNWIHQKGIEPDLKVEQPAYFTVTPFSRKQTLVPDMVGDDVKSLQVMLTGLGLAPERTDGYFSAKTAEAVKAFQRLQGMPMTGEVDTALMEQLEKTIVAQIRDPRNDAQLRAAVRVLQQKLAR